MLEVPAPLHSENDSKTQLATETNRAIESYLGRVLNQVQLGVKQLKRNQGSILTNILNQSTDVGTNLKDVSSSFIQQQKDEDDV